VLQIQSQDNRSKPCLSVVIRGSTVGWDTALQAGRSVPALLLLLHGDVRMLASFTIRAQSSLLLEF
jgi:hypothetical protein